MPASASTSPSRGRIDRDAAEAAGERLDRGALDLGVDRRAHGACRLRGVDGGEHALAGAQLAARRARQLARRTRARARSGRPARPGGTPRRASSAARSGGAGPRRPAISDGERAELGQSRLALGEHRAVARLDRRARRHRRRARSSFSPWRRPGWTSCGVPVDRRRRRRCSTTGSASVPVRRAEDARAQRDTGTPTVPSCGSRGAARRDPRERRGLGGARGRRAAKRSGANALARPRA